MRHRILHTLTLPILVVAGLAYATAAPVGLQTVATEHLQFETASIKPNGSGSGPMAFGCHGTDTTRPNSITQIGSLSGKQSKVISAPLGSCIATNASLKMLIAYAYNLNVGSDQLEQRVLFGPVWEGTARFDIEAKAEKPLPEADLRTMLQTLLADQFKLQIHHDIQEGPGYVLVVAKGGAKLKAPSNDVQMDRVPKPGFPREPAGVLQIMPVPMPGGGAQIAINGHWVTISNLASFLSARLGKPVIDHTQLTGTYDITVVLSPQTKGAGAFSGMGGDLAPWFSAIQEQLGLRLEAQRLSTDTIIIDGAERPPQN